MYLVLSLLLVSYSPTLRWVLDIYEASEVENMFLCDLPPEGRGPEGESETDGLRDLEIQRCW